MDDEFNRTSYCQHHKTGLRPDYTGKPIIIASYFAHLDYI